MFPDISAINRKNKARYSSIIVCITFAQYCTVLCKSNASEMSEFRSLFMQTFQESSSRSSSDNLGPFE